MKLEYRDICTSSTIAVDGEILEEPTKEELIALCSKVLNTMDERILEQTLKDLVIGSSIDYDDLGKCDQCGDYSTVYRLEVD